MKKSKKVLSAALALAMCVSIGSMGTTASAAEQIISQANTGRTRATVHESTRNTNWNGTQAWTEAEVFDGSSVYYLKASIQAYSQNGAVKGAYKANSNTKNISKAESGKVAEKNSDRNYYSKSECKETSSSSTEVLDGYTDTF